MQIPLDFYRILGVPVQATEEQISQAYRDRILQILRREYTELAIDSRKKLLDRAYEVLSNPQRRTEYNQLIEKTHAISGSAEGEQPIDRASNLEIEEIDRHTPSIEINKDEFIGALLVLQELGEYELILRLGHPYLDKHNIANLESDHPEQQKNLKADLVLTLAIACLELGREYWQQGEYENAAISGQTGLDLLLREGLFPLVRAEIQTDLYKLRPYRILELLSLDEDQPNERLKGLQLLKDMLQERGGIDGLADDRSGLSIDDFLHFIQQIRIHLTVAQQQELFEAESRRPSGVAAYLAVYALLARGFSEKKPELITRAKEMLLPLGKRQDVHLEQAVCALLLGQTGEASHALELSQEHESLAFIRQNSQGDPDLLPGLCKYADNWLQNEVFTHFKDLKAYKITLKEYFADRQVQTYLEQLPVSNAYETELSAVDSRSDSFSKQFPERKTNSLQFSGTQNPARGSTNSGVGLLERTQEKRSSRPNSKLSVRRSSDSKSIGWNLSKARSLWHSLLLSFNRKERPTSNKRQPKPALWLGLAVIGLLGLATIGLAQRLLQKQEELVIELNRPPVPIPIAGRVPIAPSSVSNGDKPILSEDNAREAIQAWLYAKSQAFGKEHKIDGLNEILAEPLLSTQRKRAEAIKKGNAYLEYTHSIKLLKLGKQKSDKASIEAKVAEKANFYQSEKPISAKSYDEELMVRYDLVVQSDRWYINNLKVIK